MSDFTRRLTWPDEDRPDDWVFLYKGKDVGRCYRRHQTDWLWTIYSPRKAPGVAERGYEESLGAAQEKFKTNFLKMFGLPI